MNDVSRSNLAAVDASGHPTAWDPPAPDDTVFALALSGDTLYAGGDFSNVGSTVAPRLARFDTTTGALDTSWTPGPDGDSPYVRALALSGDTLYVGGHFDTIGESAIDNLARFDTRPATSTRAGRPIPARRPTFRVTSTRSWSRAAGFTPAGRTGTSVARRSKTWRGST